MAREVRERERNTREESIVGINEDMEDMGNDMERERDDIEMDRAALASAEAKAHRLVSDINGVR